MKRIFSFFVVLMLLGCAGKGAGSGSGEKLSIAESRYKMGLAYLSSDADHRAYTELNGALELFPEDDRYLYTMGLFFIKKERYTEALPFVKKALDKKPADSEYINAYATVLAGLGNVDEAVSYWDKVIADPGYPYHIIALYNAGNALYSAGRYSLVPSYIDRALEINRRYAEAYRLLFNSFIKNGNKAKAEETVLRAVNTLPDDPYFLLLAGEFYFDHQSYAKAVPFLERLMDSYPDTQEGKRAKELMKRLGLMNE